MMQEISPKKLKAEALQSAEQDLNASLAAYQANWVTQCKETLSASVFSPIKMGVRTLPQMIPELLFYN